MAVLALMMRAAACHVTGGNVEKEQYRLVVAGR